MADNQEPSTRERILETAREAFIESGFDGATVRSICGKAGANVAAVNYHFGDKSGLYLAVLEAIVDDAFSSNPLELQEGADAKEHLQCLVRSFLARIFHCHERPEEEGERRLVAHALSTPSPALNVLVERYIRPMSNQLRDILSRLLDMDKDHTVVWRCAKSVASQCLHYLYGLAMMRRLEPAEADNEDIDEVSEHIVRFSLGGIRDIAEVSKR